MSVKWILKEYQTSLYKNKWCEGTNRGVSTGKVAIKPFNTNRRRSKLLTLIRKITEN
jgi:hypothetical protein